MATGPLCPEIVALQQDKGKLEEGVDEGAPQQSKGAMSKEQQLITGCVRLLLGAAVAKVKLPHCTTDAVARSHTSRPWPLLLAQRIGVSVIRITQWQQNPAREKSIFNFKGPHSC